MHEHVYFKNTNKLEVITELFYNSGRNCFVEIVNVLARRLYFVAISQERQIQKRQEKRRYPVLPVVV